MAENTDRASVLLEKFLVYLRVRKGRAEDTIYTYRSVLMPFIAFIGDCDVKDITVAMIDEYAESLSVRSYKPKTIKNKLTPIRSFVSFLYAKDYIDMRPESIDLPSIEEAEANFLESFEQVELIAACKDLRERAMVLCFLRSGVRVSEFVNLRVGDLYKRSLIIRRGKGGEPRPTFITEDAEKAIKKYTATLPKGQRYLFPNASGERLSRQYVHRKIVEIASRTSIDKPISPHTLRHSFATDMLRRGARAEDVQPMMGHKNIRTTLIYMHFTNDYLHKQYDKIMAQDAFA